ncbi:hypothetical protein [Micromonospora sp. CA-111912]|uniref:hypothetical protein n=1 Tax=Micromonospora sp. CA-111912 TaxID=3239955 RepID=UPI003D94C61B
MAELIEVERAVNCGGGISLGQHIVLAAEILAGRRIGIRIEPTTLMFYDLGTRPAGPPPRPSIESETTTSSSRTVGSAVGSGVVRGHMSCWG